MNVESAHTLYLGMGSNLHNRTQNLSDALELVSRKLGRVQQTSFLYRTQPWGLENQPEYYNCVAEIKTSFKPDFAMKVLLGIEEKMGRIRTQRWSPRVIDLDILYYDQLVISTEWAIIPHPQIQNRKFVLIPLCDIAGNYIHPLLQKSNRELLNICTDKHEVTRITP